MTAAKSVTVTVPAELARRLEEIARSAKVSLDDVVLQGLESYAWLAGDVRAAETEAEAGDLAEPDEVEALFGPARA